MAKVHWKGVFPALTTKLTEAEAGQVETVLADALDKRPEIR